MMSAKEHGVKTVEKIYYTFTKANPPSAFAGDGEIIRFIASDCYGWNGESNVPVFNSEKLNGATGPVSVEGAMPGDILAVDILDVSIGRKGFLHCSKGCGPLGDVAKDRLRVIDVIGDEILFNETRWKVEPMIGVIGVAPGKDAISNCLSGTHGGNMDCRLITKGVTVYFPVRAEGALLSLGDFHASMGDGEVCGTGIEIQGEAVARVRVLKKTALEWPLVETADAWHVVTSGDSFEDAVTSASHELRRLLAAAWRWDASDIYMYLSARGAIGVNQCVFPCSNVQYSVRFSVPKELSKSHLLSAPKKKNDDDMIRYLESMRTKAKRI
jgi:amidase